MAQTKEEISEKQRVWRENNPEKVALYAQNKKEKGGDKYNPDYYAKNKEAFKERQYKSNEKHIEKRKAYLKAYYEENKEKLKAQATAYIKKKNEEEKPIMMGDKVYNKKTKKFE